ncbi:MAG: hypothetical protein KGQ66_04365 [Acidobacteriota bacterium]|nr:hypothetical protein [Acidobacteriota bacterium]
MRQDLLSDAPSPAQRIPKRPDGETQGLAGLFPYYAGYAYDWAQHQLEREPSHSSILDPWNGSGTTTMAAARLALTAVGTDLNPVANAVALLKLTGLWATPTRPPKQQYDWDPSEAHDPLDYWLEQRTRRRFRQWLASAERQSLPSRLLLQVALFGVLRQTTAHFQGSNPTWVRRARASDEHIYLPDDELDHAIVRRQKMMVETLSQEQPLSGLASVLRASAAELPLRPSSVDRILTSPPYMTRIDYAIAYSRELALMGIDVWSDRRFRLSLMGSTLIRSREKAIPQCKSDLARDTWADIKSHPSKDSSGYYSTQASQYLSDMAAALKCVTRVARDDAHMTLVVQDSTYKEQHLSVSEIWMAEAAELGWVLCSKKPFPVRRSLITLNVAAQEYPKPPVAETVLDLRLERKEVQ